MDAEIIIQCGVHFMAETSKLLNPEKTVLIPDLAAGCSLAESITAEDVRLMRQRYPGLPVVTYVNTSATVKAESIRIFNRTFAVTSALNAFTLGVAGIALFTSLLTLAKTGPLVFSRPKRSSSACRFGRRRSGVRAE